MVLEGWGVPSTQRNGIRTYGLNGSGRLVIRGDSPRRRNCRRELAAALAAGSVFVALCPRVLGCSQGQLECHLLGKKEHSRFVRVDCSALLQPGQDKEHKEHEDLPRVVGKFVRKYTLSWNLFLFKSIRQENGGFSTESSLQSYA